MIFILQSQRYFFYYQSLYLSWDDITWCFLWQVDIDTNRAKVVDLEKRQRNFDKLLNEEKLVYDRCLQEKETAEREAREKETRILSLNRWVISYPNLMKL